MKTGKFPLLIIMIVSLIIACNSSGEIYYIDSITGSDANDGLSPENAWQTLAKANKGIYQAGDQILLKGGQTFTESLKLESVSGKPGLPVIISSYGGERAQILSGDSVAVSVSRCNFVIVKNLICKGSGRLNGNYTSGLEFTQNRNLSIDNVEVSGYLFSGITVRGGSDIRITNVYAHENGYCGIHVTGLEPRSADVREKPEMSNIYIGYSVAENNPGSPAIKDNHSGNGILVGNVTNALIEYCEAMNNGWDMPRDGNGPVGIWAYASDSVIIQYCYSHNNKTSERGHDGGGFDFDGGVTNSIMQYNMSAFNEGAGYGIYQYGSAVTWSNNIVRYNISYHDGSKNGQCGIHVWTHPEAAYQMTNLHAYNNTVVNKYYGVNFTPGHYENFVFGNNIFLITESAGEFIGGGVDFTGAFFDKNLYYNIYHANFDLAQPDILLDENALLTDPLLVLPPDEAFLEYDALTINSFPFFKLQSGSPGKQSGKVITDNGGRDYWGNSIIETISPNIGAHGE